MFNYKIKQPSHSIITKADGSRFVRITEPKRDHIRGMHLSKVIAEIPLPEGVDSWELLKELYKEEQIW